MLTTRRSPWREAKAFSSASAPEPPSTWRSRLRESSAPTRTCSRCCPTRANATSASMSTLPSRSPSLCRVLLVGTGGVGAPTAIALAESGVGTLVLADEDQVELENLHRQLLFDDGDIGQSKPVAAKRALEKRRPSMSVEVVEGRALPATARDLLAGVHPVGAATHNFPS